MTDQPQTPEPTSTTPTEPAATTPPDAAPTGPAGPEPELGGAPSSPPFAPPAGQDGAAQSEHPEIPVAAAFAGGFVVAMILKRLAR